MEFTDRTENVSVVDIIKQNGFHHSECYQTFSNLNEVKRAEKCLSSLNNDKQSAQTMLDRKVGRPSFKQGNQLEYKKLKKKLYGPFLWMGFNCLKATATSRRQFTFYHSVPRKSWYSFYQPQKDERLS